MSTPFPTDAIISAESGGNPNAKNPNSSASGPGQFIDSTFLATLKSARPDIAQGKSDADLLALKNDLPLNRELTDYYANQNQSTLAKAGLPVTPGTTYLAHFAGPGDAVKILQADPGTSVSDIVRPAVMKANPFLSGMTAQGLQAWAAKKMGTPGAVPGSQGAPAGAPPPPQPASAPPPLPAPGQAPIFAGQPQAAPQGQQMASAAPAPMAPQQPIFAPEPAPIDLSGLRAALAARQAPQIFARRG